MPHPRRLALAVILAAATSLAVPGAGPEAAIRPVYVQVLAYTTARVDRQVGFIPIQGLLRAAGDRGTPAQAGGRRFRLLWTNATVSRTSTSQALREIARNARYRPVQDGVFADRRLTARERQRFEVLADIGRDADVLVVSAGHPACGGLTRAQAHGVASGAITRWSSVTSVPAGQPEAIVRHATWTGRERSVEPRLGLPQTAPAGIRLDGDGGLGAVARGDRSAAAITSWSRARAYRAGVCVVPLDGVAPTDESVRALRYAEAYPISWVCARKRPADALSRATSSAYAAYMRSPAAAALFAATGILTTTPPAAAQPSTK